MIGFSSLAFLNSGCHTSEIELARGTGQTPGSENYSNDSNDSNDWVSEFGVVEFGVSYIGNRIWFSVFFAQIDNHAYFSSANRFFSSACRYDVTVKVVFLEEYVHMAGWMNE